MLMTQGLRFIHKMGKQMVKMSHGKVAINVTPINRQLVLKKKICMI